MFVRVRGGCWNNLEVPGWVRRGNGNGWGALATLVLGAALAGCGHDDGDLLSWSFSADENIKEQTVPGDSVGGTLTLTLPPISMDLTKEPEYQKEAFDLLKGVSVTGLTLTITSTSTNTAADPQEDGKPDDFSFLTSISVFIDGTVSGVTSSERIAFIDPGDPQLNAGIQTVNFQVKDVNLLPYIEAGGYSLRIEVTGTVPPDNVIFDGVVDYKIKVGIL